jgi:hypothetical protein
METANQAIALGANHWTKKHFAHAVVHPVTGKNMEYMALMKDPVGDLIASDHILSIPRSSFLLDSSYLI